MAILMLAFGLRKCTPMHDWRMVVAEKLYRGQVIGLINDIPSCEELVKRIEREAEESIANSQAMIMPQSKL